jgi:hypothetical protein
MGEKAATTTVAARTADAPRMRAAKEVVEPASEGAGYGRTHIGTGSSEGRYVVSAVGVVGVVGVRLASGRHSKGTPNFRATAPTVRQTSSALTAPTTTYLALAKSISCWQTRSSNDRPGEGGCTQANAETGALKSVCRLRDVDAEVWEVTGPSARHYARLERLVWRRFFSATLAEESTGDMRR